MYHPPEADALSRVCGRSMLAFSGRKEHRKPVRWYTRLIVYGNPGRVVNGYAPGIPVLICGFGVVVCGGSMLVLCSYRGTRPRFASGTLMSLSDDTAPPRDAPGLAGVQGSYTPPEATSGYPLGCSPQRSKERAERPRGWVPLQERRKGIAYPPTPACRNEDKYRFPCGAKLSTAFPSGN